ncbi:unnamed protein product [Diatraea saccharalis]|uniref:Cubilin n=1 Tax=Diatraea saccharalis TaxID=40085 RepID=A0A9N9WF04_9NEOP|nr:unnamed protein product [Diatraea saccharalis]
MSTILIRCLVLVVWFVQLKCQSFQNRPKISTLNGHLILEAAHDQNIYLRANGPKSGIFVEDMNLLHLSISDNSDRYPVATNDNFEKFLSGSNGILIRLDRLEREVTATPQDHVIIRNITLLTRRINRLNNRVITLQSQISNMASDQCRNNPCENGGTCLNLVNGYHCLCPPNWEGKNCDVDVNECRNFAGTDLGCQNGASCINKPGTYECFCASGWFGIHCTRRAKDCSAGNFEMCGFGTCVPVTSGEGIKCICNQGWQTNDTSVACLTDINECDSSHGVRCSANPKVDCINLPGSFRCGQCPSGYEGDGFVCHDINECETIANGGCSPLVACHNTIGSRICGPCPPGYQGDGTTCTWRGSCNINHGGCHPSAQCVESMAVVQCICPLGMDGDGVGFQGCYITTGGNSTQHCENNPCVNGHCHSVRSGYTCLCNEGYSGVHCEIPVDYCSSNPCQHGGSCRPGDSSTGFRCECTAEYTGNLCQIKAKSCSGVLDAEEGSLIYPLTNSSYDHNSKCAWVIHTAMNKVINVTFNKFNLEPEPECMYDFLQIHDGRTSSSQLIGRFCGNELPKGGNIISSSNNLYLWFRSDKTVSKEGFSLHWDSIKPICGGEIDATTYGHINSPGSPGKYPPNRDCYWHLTSTFGKRILLHFFALDIESHSNCSFDYLAIYDGEDTSNPLVKYCNSTQPAPLQSSSSEMIIHFHSDAYGSGNGFQITYAPVEGIPGCGGYYTLDKGEIVSPSYNGYYLDNLLCEYKIVASPDSKIRIDFKSFKLESSVRCRYDYLKVYDGPSTNSKLVGRFCGSSYPKSFVSSSNSLFIIFKSDHSATSEGFKISFETICQKIFFGDSGIIKSPGYPFSYPANKVCEYIIGTVPGKAIQLTFQDFDIEDNLYFNCKYDNVEIRDGSDRNATLLGIFCGGSEHIPPVQTSTHNYLYIRFNSDMSISGTGFYANYTTIDTECGGIYKDTTGLIKHPSGEDSTSTTRNNQKCTWVLIAPEGMHIKITWNNFEIENHVTCDSDYVELIEIDSSNNNETLGKFCGVSHPPSLTTTTNRLMIRFQSDASIRSAGFSLSYTFLDERTHCGAVYAKSHGFIYSPGWPKKYEPNRDCTWTITVPVGQQIMLNISQFDLERPIRDKCDLGDYLEIRNGATRNSPLIGKYCGNFKSKRIISMANKLYLRFHSDYYLTGNGFKIEWDGTITGCGGTLTSPQGTISSPNYPDDYYENAECFYRIVANEGSRIRIRFADLDLERMASCKDDYVEIFDGRDENSNSFGKFCYMNPTLNIIETTSNTAFIKFQTDFYIVSKGFLINFDTICQANISGKYGVIESPGYPGNYGTDLNCLWTINAPKGHKINVTFTHFNIVTSYRPSWSSRFRPKCHSHYLQWKEGNQPDFSEKYCGNSVPHIKSTQSNSLQIKFVTGSYRTLTGFRLEWLSYGCGGYYKKRFGSINMDRRSTASGEMECEWLIESPLGTSIIIIFNSVYMTDSPNCSVDSIEVFNGQTSNSPILTKFCHHSNVHIQSTSKFMLIRLTKRSNLKDLYFTSTFHSWQSSCGADIAAASGSFYSKNYPNNYDNNLDCIWKITVPINHRIELNFIDLDLYYEGDEDCNDRINLYYTPFYRETNYTEIICPRTQTKQFISKSNILTLQFLTDGENTAKGFKVNFTMICGAIINATRDGIIANNQFLRHTNKSCIWTILAPRLDQKITLTLTHMSLSKNYDVLSNKSCPSTFLRIHDGDDDMSPIVGEFCGRKIPPSIVSHGYALTIELGTYGNNIEGTFSAHYTSFSSACGGTLTSEEGAISSPNYPHPYPINTDCEWTLETSPGNKVYILFENFKLQYSENCNQDYVEVRENDSGGPLLGLYCGNDIPTNTTSAAKLYIKFHSDDQATNTGFMINYGFIHGNDISGSNDGRIASPLYPSLYEGAAEYSWRVTVSSGTITLRVSRLQIMAYGDSCSNYLAIYDGYDEEAFLLENLCGIINYNEKSLQTTSNVVYIKLKLDYSNTGSLFFLEWTKTDSITNDYPFEKKINCGSNHTQLVEPGEMLTFTSPNYPAHYDNNLNCTWFYKTTAGYHLRLDFPNMKLEETSGCFADSLSIFTSDNFNQWQPIKSKVCLHADVDKIINASTYVKITFKTDNSITAKGFEATVQSVCGGIITDVSGVVSPSWLDWIRGDHYFTKCEWKIKVKPGRLIKLDFLLFNITNSLECTTFVTLHNGESSESPLLGSGKFCGFSHEDRSIMTTSSNSLVITYTTNSLIEKKFKSFKLWYEEKTIECGSTGILSSDHTWEVITSPNYPSIPRPYTECVWKFSGPPGEILRIDFDRIDLDKQVDCNLEYIEVRDGASELAPLKERFCNTENPGTLKTSNNVLFVKYSTQKVPPNNGFKANVSVDVCGGTIVAKAGQITSPGYPHKPRLKYGSLCEWRIIGNPLYTFMFQAQDINLPESEAPCDTRVTIEESFPENNTVTVLKKFCNDEIFNAHSHGLIETLTNDVIIKLRIGKPSVYTQSSNYRGFRLTFNSSIPKCGGIFDTPEGYLSTPGYPRYTTLRSCHWKINVPDETRRVTLKFIDADIERHRINIYNDEFHRSLIQTIPSEDYSPTTQVIESSGSTMSLYIWLDPSIGSRHRFKAKYSSENPALCGERLIGLSGQFISPMLDRSYTCNWKYNFNSINFASVNSTDLLARTIHLRVHINSSVTSTVCRYTDPRLTIKSTLSNRAIKYNQILCKDGSETDLRIPSDSVSITALKRIPGSFSFNVRWKIQPCGGVVYVTENPINIIEVPNNYNDSLDCAWLLVIPIGRRIEMKLDGIFQLNCEDEFITVNSDFSTISRKIGDYCKERTLESPIQLKYSTLYIQYHTTPKDETKIKLIVKNVENQCGGYLMTYESVFESPNYPKSYSENQECTWEIVTDIGSRISLQFIGRFAVESRPNCTKDAVIVYNWKDNKYIEMSRLCGRTLPPIFNSTFNKMKVVLRTDNEINLDGFQARWLRICGGDYNATENEQFLYSPGYPNGYTGNLNCVYRISASKGTVLLKFLEFELEGPYPDCNNDNLTISGESASDFLYDTTYCGNEMPPIINYEKITLTFQTDYFMNQKGFKISYILNSCGGEITEPTIIKSNPTEYYNNNLNCTWFIKAPTDKTVSLRFLYFDLESSSACYNDFLAIYDGLLINNEKRLGLLCGEGCGGYINLTTTSTYNLKSPLIGSKLVYEHFLDCHWTVVAPMDHVIKVKFTSFHIAPCQDVNQTALGYNNCDCDFVELIDGIAPNSVIIDKFCGHTLPPELVSSSNGLTVRLFTDGEVNSSGFEATLSAQESVCGQSSYTVTKSIQRITSPGYGSGSLLRGIHCVYHIATNTMETTYLNIKNIDLLPSAENKNQCNKDKLIISKLRRTQNITLGKDWTVNMDSSLFVDHAYLLQQSEVLNIPTTFTYCGSHKAIEFYLVGSVTITLLTSAESGDVSHKGFELEFSKADYCGRNYTEPYGRIKSLEMYEYESKPKEDCYTLITAPENYTISAYFLRLSPTYWVEASYLEIFDGDKTSDRSLRKIGIEYDDILSVSSTGRHMLIHNHVFNDGYIAYDLTYVTTDKGSGCGGLIKNELGRITSPMYPSVYRRRITCEWELETPVQTRLHLHFNVFDLGRACDQIYLQLIDRHGKIISTYCSETPADYISEDNYVKVIFVSTMNNGGTGWVAEFAGVKPLI